ncbi:MAG: hypothetical protein RLZZ546_989 [Bacteroidota bacterium]|jgi:predicted peptidase
MIKWIIVFVALSIIAAACTVRYKDFNFIKNQYIKSYHHSKQGILPYQIIGGNKKMKQYPLIIFMHGAGERGADNEKQLVHGKNWMQENLNKFGGIAVFPQCPTNDFWSSVDIETTSTGSRIFQFNNKEATPAMNMVLSLIDSLYKLPYIDQDRIYVMGLSMGGMASFELMWRRQGMFAAGAPICGGMTLSKAKEVAATPGIWIFHGSADEVVKPEFSREATKALLNFNKNVKYTEYDGVGHNSWDNVFKEKDFFKWLYSHSLKNKK